VAVFLFFAELADFLTFSALAAALDDHFELLAAVINARLRQVLYTCVYTLYRFRFWFRDTHR